MGEKIGLLKIRNASTGGVLAFYAGAYTFDCNLKLVERDSFSNGTVQFTSGVAFCNPHQTLFILSFRRFNSVFTSQKNTGLKYS